eukprot:scaffold3836_cov20-Tisochrysis_lutea.AAC.3
MVRKGPVNQESRLTEKEGTLIEATLILKKRGDSMQQRLSTCWSNKVLPIIGLRKSLPAEQHQGKTIPQATALQVCLRASIPSAVPPRSATNHRVHATPHLDRCMWGCHVTPAHGVGFEICQRHSVGDEGEHATGDEGHDAVRDAATGMPTHQTRFPLLKEKESVQMSWNASSEDN